MKILHVVGTLPNIIKFAPVRLALSSVKWQGGRENY